jgi:diacylglycerol kinase family enzyme
MLGVGLNALKSLHLTNVYPNNKNNKNNKVKSKPLELFELTGKNKKNKKNLLPLLFFFNFGHLKKIISQY